MSRNLLVYSDIDGVLTPCNKLFHCVGPTMPPMDKSWQEVEDRWFKLFSDRDSFVLRHMKDDIVFISNDKRNKYYTDYKGHKFCFVDHKDGDKYDGLKKDWAKRVENGEVEGETNHPRYFYIGDSPFDWLCIKNAMHSFVPSDASRLLIEKIKRWHVRLATVLESKGGEGCIEEMMFLMIAVGNADDLSAVKTIKEFLYGDVQQS